MSALRNFIRDVNRACETLPPGAHATSVRMNRKMFQKLKAHAALEGMDITKSTWGLELPDNYDGLIASLRIRTDNRVPDGAVDVDYEFEQLP